MTPRLRAHGITALLVGVLVGICAVFLNACAADTVTSPERACTNAVTPPTFRVVMGTLTKRDTLPRMANRYTVPLRNADTTIVTLYDGSHIAAIRGGIPGECLKLTDSLESHMSGLWGWIE